MEKDAGEKAAAYEEVDQKRAEKETDKEIPGRGWVSKVQP